MSEPWWKQGEWAKIPVVKPTRAERFWSRMPSWLVEVVYRAVDPVIHAKRFVSRHGCGWPTLCAEHSYRHRFDE